MGTQDLTVIHGQVPTQRQEFTQGQVDLLKNTVCRGATDGEFQLFLEVCRAKKLDPFSKQIHAVKRSVKDGNSWKEVMSFQIGIDGFRAIAERTGKYAGQGDTLWCGKDGAWKDVWLDAAPPVAARVTVYKVGFAAPMSRVALYKEYVQTTSSGNPNSMWSKMPANQLAKCAESLALRAAFPEELSGLYTTEEMGQADSEHTLSDVHVARAKEPASVTRVHPSTPAAPGSHTSEQPTIQEAEVVEDDPVSVAVSTPAPKDNQHIPEGLQDLWRKMFKPEQRRQVIEQMRLNMVEAFGEQKGPDKFYEILSTYNAKQPEDYDRNLQDARRAVRDMYRLVEPILLKDKVA